MSTECSECEHDLRMGHAADCSRCPRCVGCGESLRVEDEEIGYVCPQCLRPDAAPPKGPNKEMVRRLHDVLVSVEPFLDHEDADVYLRSEVANLRGTLANMVERAVLAAAPKEG